MSVPASADIPQAVGPARGDPAESDESFIYHSDGAALLSGKGSYIADVKLPGMLEIAFLRSPTARARIKSISTQAAAASEGVLYVATGPDILRSIPTALPQVKAARIRALAISSSARSPAVPDLPTVAEAGRPGFQVDPWCGVLAPSATPKEIVLKLHTEINKHLLDPTVKERMATLGVDIVIKTPEQFGSFLAEEMAMWTKVVKASGAKVD